MAADASYGFALPDYSKQIRESQAALDRKNEEQARYDQEFELKKGELDERRAEREAQARQRGLSQIQSGVRLDRMPVDDQAYIVSQDALSKLQSNLISKLNNKSIDPIALQTEINEGMKGITKASNTFILEHNEVDKFADTVAKDNPSIDIVKLKNKLRDDVRNRRIKEGQFVDPNQVEDSALIGELSNPENLSPYITEYNALDNIIKGKQSSRNIEAKLGTPQSYTTYSGKMGFWNKPTFEVEPSGFIKKGGKIPSLTYGGVEIANEPLPANSLSMVDGKKIDEPLDMIPQSVYDKFLTEGGNNAQSEIVSLAQKQFTPEAYKKFSPQEKGFANRNALYKFLKDKDKEGFVGLSESSYNPPPSYAGPRATEGEKRAVIIGKYLDTLKNASLSGNEDDITNAFDKFYGLKGGKYEYDGVKVVPDKDGKISQIIIGLKDKDGIKYETLDVKDKNFKSKLGGVYQKISGSETAAEIKDLNDLETKNNAKFTATGKGGIKIFSQDGVNWVDANGKKIQ
jgi:hypothetical protein